MFLVWHLTTSCLHLCAGRQWVFQTCSQFAYFQTTDSFNQPFGSLFPLKFFLQQCLDIYGPKFTPETIEGAVEWTNTYYGAREIASSATNIVFPNGSIDPWHALGITSTTSKTVEAIFINGTAHCANMYPPRDSDLEELKDARIKITTLISVVRIVQYYQLEDVWCLVLPVGRCVVFSGTS